MSCPSYKAPLGVYSYTTETWPSGAGTTQVFDGNVHDLRGSIAEERTRRGLGAYSFTPGYSFTSTPIYGQTATNTNEAIRELKTAINQIRSIVTISIVDGTPVTYAQIRHLRNKIEQLRAECICFGDCAYTPCSCNGACACDYTGCSIDYFNAPGCGSDTGN